MMTVRELCCYLCGYVRPAGMVFSPALAKVG